MDLKLQSLEKDNFNLLEDKKRNTSDFTNPEREINRMLGELSSHKNEENNLRNSLQRKDDELKVARD